MTEPWSSFGDNFRDSLPRMMTYGFLYVLFLHGLLIMQGPHGRHFVLRRFVMVVTAAAALPVIPLLIWIRCWPHIPPTAA